MIMARKAWEEAVLWASSSTECADRIGLPSAILAADAELTALRAEVERLKEALRRARGLNGTECMATGGGYHAIRLEKIGQPAKRCGRCIYCVIDTALRAYEGKEEK